MQPYVTPKAVLRETEGRNPVYDQIFADAKKAAGKRAEEGNKDDVEVLFGMMR